MSREGRFEAWLPGPLDAPARAAIDRLAATADVRAVAIMPDAHLAGEVCVGTVVATRSTLLPEAIGGDIGCGVLAQRFDGEAAVLRDEHVAARIMAGLYQMVPEARHVRRRVLPERLLPRLACCTASPGPKDGEASSSFRRVSCAGSSRSTRTFPVSASTFRTRSRTCWRDTSS